jgi:hypothetical protein
MYPVISTIFSYTTLFTTVLTQPLGDVDLVEGPAEYVSSVYVFLVTIVGVVSLTGVVYGAVVYTSSAGNASRRTLGLKRMIEAIIGLILLLSASLILKTLNPALLGLEDPAIPDAEQYQPGPDVFGPPPPSGPPPSTVPMPLPT